ncbi:Ataxin-3 [Rhizoclosmatium sp. JEL0117]|nr:Ataxin-3 [Rhizoclosmatium sp. JEL0117]
MDLVELGLVFHERQEGQLCAQHALNAVLQGSYFSAVDLSQLARDLDSQELEALADGATTPPTPNTRAKFQSQNYDDSGFFSIQVLEKALGVWNLTLTPLTSPAAKQAREDPASIDAFILNLDEHWLTLRRFGGSRSRFYNLDSTLERPKYVSEFYLQALLSELSAAGYSVFVVGGNLPSSDADAYATSVPIPPQSTTQGTKVSSKEDAASTQKGLVAFSGKGYSLGSGSGDHGNSNSVDEDPELAAAIAMSMSAGIDEETQELQKALAMSIQPPKIESQREESELDIIRRKRLEALNKRF